MWKESLGEEISVFGFEGINYFKAQWLSWLERRPVTAEVVGSSPIWVVCKFGILAQLGEHLPYKQRVTGSSPVGPTCIERYELNIYTLWAGSRVAKGGRL